MTLPAEAPCSACCWVCNHPSHSSRVPHCIGFCTRGNHLKTIMGQGSSLWEQQGLFAVCHQFWWCFVEHLCLVTRFGVGSGYMAVLGLADGGHTQGHHCGIGRRTMSSDCPQHLCCGPVMVSILFLMVLDMLSLGEGWSLQGCGSVIIPGANSLISRLNSWVGWCRNCCCACRTHQPSR